MFEDSLIESGGQAKNEAWSNTIFSFIFQVVLGRRPGSDSAAIHRSVAQAAADDIPGGSATTAATAATAGCGPGEGGEDRSRATWSTASCAPRPRFLKKFR